MPGDPARSPAVVGVADHSGWANLVTVAGRDRRPVLVDRRRCELVGPDVPRQPYHAARGLSDAAATELVDQVSAAAAGGARDALASLVSDLAGEQVLAVVVRAPGGRPPPETVAGVLASHSAMHAAEGQLYRDALAGAAAELGLAAAVFERGAVDARAATRLGLSAAAVAALLAELGARCGPPWRAEHREAAAAALCELADHVDLSVDG
jgi:post-segregation antitoxin (ccd killing protein)